MIRATVGLESASPYSQGKHYSVRAVPKKEKESNADYEVRTWMNRGHYTGDESEPDDKRHIYIPEMAFKNCIAEAAKYLSITIPGKGKATYTKHFEAGIIVSRTIILPETLATVQGGWQFIPSDGVRGGGKCVEKCFPVIQKWSGEVEFLVLDQTITEDIFQHILREAGRYIGIGVWRPRRNGLFGRFNVTSLDWVEVPD